MSSLYFKHFTETHSQTHCRGLLWPDIINETSSPKLAETQTRPRALVSVLDYGNFTCQKTSLIVTQSIVAMVKYWGLRTAVI